MSPNLPNKVSIIVSILFCLGGEAESDMTYIYMTCFDLTFDCNSADPKLLSCEPWHNSTEALHVKKG